MAGDTKLNGEPEVDTTQALKVTRVEWDDSRMASVFANVINVLHTREEFSILFGTNESWNLTDLEVIKVALSNRLILTPFAAKRLLSLLGQHVSDYEARFGQLAIDR